MIGVCMAAATWSVAAPSARADDLATPSLVADLVVEIMLQAEAFQPDVLIVPDVTLAPPQEAVKGRIHAPGAVHFFGRGIDVSGEVTGHASDGSVLLALRPNFGNPGGVLRCTFRFE